jgi:hypothetical protein
MPLAEGNGGSNAYNVRMILLQSSLPLASTADVLDYTAGINPMAPYNLLNIGQNSQEARVSILADEMFTFSKNGTEGVAVHKVFDNFKWPYARYSGSSFSEPISGNFYMIFTTNQTVAGSHPQYRFYSRVLYTDA